MLAQVRKYRRKILAALFCAVAITFGSCASQKDSVRLVDDPDDRGGGSSLPWSHQEKWEVAPDANALGPTASSDVRR
jgi:hypothetical protein